MDQLKTRGKLKGTLGLVVVGTGGDGVAWLAEVRAEPGIEPAAAFVLGKCATEPSGGVYVHGGGGRSGLGLTRGRGFGGKGLVASVRYKCCNNLVY